MAETDAARVSLSAGEIINVTKRGHQGLSITHITHSSFRRVRLKPKPGLEFTLITLITLITLKEE